jgi:hypothetical protein
LNAQLFQCAAGRGEPCHQWRIQFNQRLLFADDSGKQAAVRVFALLLKRLPPLGGASRIHEFRSQLLQSITVSGRPGRSLPAGPASTTAAIIAKLNKPCGT